MNEAKYREYHLYDVIDNPYPKLQYLDLSKCDTGYGGILGYIRSSEGAIITNPNSDKTITLKRREDEIFLSIACAKKKPLAMVAVKSTTSRDSFYFIQFDTNTPDRRVIYVPKEFYLNDLIQNKPCTIAINDTLSIFAYIIEERKLVIFSEPFTSKPISHLFNETITNILFTRDANNPQVSAMFVTTDHEIKYYEWTEENKAPNEKVVTSPQGAGRGLATLKEDGVLMVCNQNVITLYNKYGQICESARSSLESQTNVEVVPQIEAVNTTKRKKRNNQIITQKSRGKPIEYHLNSEPSSIYWIGHSLLCIFAKAQDSAVRIYNFTPPCIFGKAPNGDNIRYVFLEWNSVILVRTSNVITRMVEVDMNEKITSIIQNEQFDVALAIAATHKMGQEYISAIHSKRADSYYAKHKFDKSIDEYIQTIGFLEPSYVITRFIDPQYAEYLVRYLEGLQAHRLANKEHTTLLFNCYTKLRKDDKIKKYIEGSTKQVTPNYDVATAVEVLNLSGYRTEALELAKNYGLNMEYARMLAEDHDYTRICDHMRYISANEVMAILKRYGIDIVDAMKDENELKHFTTFLSLCCVAGCPIQGEDKKELVEPEEVMRVFMLKPLILSEFIDKITEHPEVCTPDVWNVALMTSVFKQKETDKNSRFDDFFSRQAKEQKYSNESLMLFFKSEDFKYGLQKIYMKDDVKFYEEYIKLSKYETIPTLFEETCPVPIWRETNSLWRYAIKYLVSETVEARKKGDEAAINTLTHCVGAMINNIVRARNEAESRVSTLYYDTVDIDLKIEDDEDEKKDDGKHRKKKETKIYREMEDINGPIDFLDLLDIISADRKLKMHFVKGIARAEFEARQNRIRRMTKIAAQTEFELVEEDTQQVKLTTCHYKANQTRCKKCNGVIDLPAKHFLCGHSYHIECLGENIDMCSECQEMQKQVIQRKLNSLIRAQENYSNPMKIINKSGVDPIFALSSMMQSDVMGTDNSDKIQEVQKVLAEYSKV